MDEQTNGVNSDPAVTLDDFAEFLTVAYRPLFDPLFRTGAVAQIDRVTSGQYALTVIGPAGSRVDVTDGGKPLPAQPGDVTRWMLLCGNTLLVVPGDLPLTDVARRITDLADRC